MTDLSVKFAGIQLKNPVITASGAFGFGHEYENFFPLSKLGGISVKGMTLNQKDGNPPPRIAETSSGILNSVGLQNPGINYFLENEMPYLKDKNTVIIANVAGSTVEDCVEIARRIEGSAVDIIELNVSCPNVKEGGVAFGVNAASANNITSEVRKATSKPLMVKLSPNVTDITEIARAVEAGGADAVSLINTVLGMKIDINTRRPVLKNNVGGLSGAAVLPIAVRMVWQVFNAVKVPVCGMGGIYTWQDAIEMILAGASTIQLGTVLFADPNAPLKVIDGIEKYMEKHSIKNIFELVGKVDAW